MKFQLNVELPLGTTFGDLLKAFTDSVHEYVKPRYGTQAQFAGGEAGTLHDWSNKGVQCGKWEVIDDQPAVTEPEAQDYPRATWEKSSKFGYWGVMFDGRHYPFTDSKDSEPLYETQRLKIEGLGTGSDYEWGSDGRLPDPADCPYCGILRTETTTYRDHARKCPARLEAEDDAKTALVDAKFEQGYRISEEERIQNEEPSAATVAEIERITEPKATKEDEEASPRYEHDCVACKPLGVFFEADLYWCPQDGIPTLVARFSNDGPDYTSGVGSSMPALREARRRAEKRGYPTKADPNQNRT